MCVYVLPYLYLYNHKNIHEQQRCREVATLLTAGYLKSHHGSGYPDKHYEKPPQSHRILLHIPLRWTIPERVHWKEFPTGVPRSGWTRLSALLECTKAERASVPVLLCRWRTRVRYDEEEESVHRKHGGNSLSCQPSITLDFVSHEMTERYFCVKERSQIFSVLFGFHK